MSTPPWNETDHPRADAGKFAEKAQPDPGNTVLDNRGDEQQTTRSARAAMLHEAALATTQTLWGRIDDMQHRLTTASITGAALDIVKEHPQVTHIRLYREDGAGKFDWAAYDIGGNPVDIGYPRSDLYLGLMDWSDGIDPKHALEIRKLCIAGGVGYRGGQVCRADLNLAKLGL